MAPQLPGAQEGAAKEGGANAPVVTTRHPTKAKGPRNLIEYSKTIGKALERLNLSIGEREAWVAIKRHMEECDQGGRRRVDTDATGSKDTQELCKEVNNLANAVKKLVEGSKQ